MNIRFAREDGVGVLRVFLLRFPPVVPLGAVPALHLIFRLPDPSVISRGNDCGLHDPIAGSVVEKA